jgi:hypothetical protein
MFYCMRTGQLQDLYFETDEERGKKKAERGKVEQGEKLSWLV